MRPIRVLITCLGGRYSVSLIRALRKDKRLGIKIVGTDTNRDVISKHFVESFHTVPSGSDKDYIPQMLRISEKEKIDIIIPGADEEVMAVSRAKGLFDKKGIICSVDNIQNIDLVMDKWKLFNHLFKNKIPMPAFKPVSEVKDIKKVADYFGYPKSKFILKPRRSRGARDVWIIGEDDGSTSLKYFKNHFEKQNIKRLNYVAMEFLPGPAYDVDLLAKFGNPICIVPRRRVWKNRLSSFCEGCKVENNTQLIRLVTKISKLLKLNYAYDFDCGTFSDGAPAIYEINPRFSGAVAASLGSGVNIPVMLVRMLKGIEIPKYNIRFDISMFPVPEMVFVDKGKVLCR